MNFVEPTLEFPQFLADENRKSSGLPFRGLESRPPWREKLPGWLAEYQMRDLGLEIGDLPYECAQRVWQVTSERSDSSSPAVVSSDWILGFSRYVGRAKDPLMRLIRSRVLRILRLIKALPL